MALDPEHLAYPKRRYGMDHDLYPWRNLFAEGPPTFADGTRLAVLITVPLEFFPLDPRGIPFRAPGSMVTPYPDFRHYTTRDYGNRVGIYRLLKVLEASSMKANVAINAAVAKRYPVLLRDILAAGHEPVAHGVDMDALHYGGMEEETEHRQIRESIDTLQEASGQPIAGWLSPAYSSSFLTPELLAAHGFRYTCDWSNDDMPYTIQTRQGDLTAVPISQELSDRRIIIDCHQSEDSMERQVRDQFEVLYSETSNQGARMLSLTLTPYISGLPFRIRTVASILASLLGEPGVRAMTGTELVEAYRPGRLEVHSSV